MQLCIPQKSMSCATFIPTTHMPPHIFQHSPSIGGNSELSIRKALFFIPADDREIWISCGMAVKAELGEAGFDLWDEWCATSDSYRARDAAAVWRSFKASGGVTIGTLLHIAQQYGYRCDSHYKPVVLSPEEITQRELKREADAALFESRRADAAN